MVKLFLHAFPDTPRFQAAHRAPSSNGFFLFQILASVAASMLGDTVAALASLALLLPALAVGVRRLHDIGKSGWWHLLVLTGIGLLVLVYWWVQPTAEGSYIHDAVAA